MKMNMRWVTLSVVAVLGLLSVPVLAQPSLIPGPRHMGSAQQPAGQPISITQAETIARQALDRAGYAGLVPGHIMEFSNHFYVAVKYKVGGQGALELLIDRYTGAVHPEPQSMMWNTQFGYMAGRGDLTHGMMGSAMMNPGAGSMWGPGSASTMMGPGGSGGGMMGPGGSTMMGGGVGPGTMGQISAPTASPSVTPAQAKSLTQKFLDSRLPGAKAEADVTVFPGYYTLDFARDGKIVGMLSVNAYTGQIWYHAWHGTFVQEKDLH